MPTLTVENSSEEAPAKPKQSNVLRFFFDFDADEVDYDPAVNALALICALVLTVPFGAMGSLNSDYFDQLKTALDACTNAGAVTYEDQFNKFLQNMALGLTFSCGYYIFHNKAEHASMTRHARMKLKFLLFCLFLSTVCAVFGIMNLSSLMFNYYTVPMSKVCTFNGAYVWGTGIFFVFLSFFGSFYLMW